MPTLGEDLQAYCQTMSPAEALGTAICLANNLRETVESPTSATSPMFTRVVAIWTASLIHDLLQERVAKGLAIVPDHTHCSAALTYFGDALRRSLTNPGCGS